jgi:hypothetical protein
MKALSPILLYLAITVYAISSSKTSQVQTQTSSTTAETSTPNATLSPLNIVNVNFVAHPQHNASNPVPTVGEWKSVDLTNPLHMKRQGSCPAGTEAAAGNSGSGRSVSAGNGNLFLWSILEGMLASLLGLALWTGTWALNALEEYRKDVAKGLGERMSLALCLWRYYFNRKIHNQNVLYSVTTQGATGNRVWRIYFTAP